MKLRTKTMLRICVNIGSIMIIGFALAFAIVYKTTYKNSVDILENTINSTSVKLDLWDQGQKNQILQTAEHMNQLKSDEDRLMFLSQTIGISGDIPNGIYYASEDKRLLYPKYQEKYDSDTTFDPTTRDWYKIFLSSSQVTTTDVYIDDATKDLCVTYGVKLADNRSVLGADVFLNSVISMLEETSLFSTGKIIVVDKLGYIIGANDASLAGVKIDEYSSELSNALAKESMPDSIKINMVDNKAIQQTNESTGWKIVAYAPEREIFYSTQILGYYFIGIALAIIIIMIIISGIIAKNVVVPIRKAQEFANALSYGDFTVEPLNITTADELEDLSNGMNVMCAKNKSVIGIIKGHVKTMNSGSEKLANAVDSLSESFEKVKAHMSQINSDTMQESAATEQVNASIEEVRASVEHLQSKASGGKQLADMIKERAESIKRESIAANENVQQLAGAFRESLAHSMENTKIVANIGNLADVISDIAGQVGLLALNASIEAARAGEQGKGFAVVASEISKLSQKTSNTVSEIQSTVSGVKEAFEKLLGESNNMLQFLTGTVQPDYNKYADVGKQYQNDAENIEDMSATIHEMALNLDGTMREVSLAVESITESAQSNADNGNKIMMIVSQVEDAVGQVADISRQEKEISYQLSSAIDNYKI